MSGSGDGGMTPSRLDIPGYRAVRGLSLDRAGALVEGVRIDSGAAVQIRVLSPAVVAERASMRRLRRDLARLSTLRHSNVVAVIRFDPRANAVVSEHAQGVTLRRVIDASGTLPVQAAFVMLHNALAGLVALHAVKVLHRDLRSDAVVVDTTGTVRLRDAGIAAPPLHAGWAAGSPQYMAPELWRGAAPSVRSDLYALTAVLVEALSGHAPYAADDLDKLRLAHDQEPVPVDVVPPPARALVLSGLAKDRRGRPRSAAEFLVDVENAAGESLEVGWYRSGEEWLADAATSRLMDPQPPDVSSEVAPQTSDVYPLGDAPLAEAGPGAPRLRRRLAVAAGALVAACVAGAMVALGASLLGHSPAATPRTHSVATAATPRPSLSVAVTEPAGPDTAGNLGDGSSPSATGSPSASASTTFTPPPTGPPSFTTVATETPSPSPSGHGSPSSTATPTPCPTLLPTPLPTPCVSP